MTHPGRQLEGRDLRLALHQRRRRVIAAVCAALLGAAISFWVLAL